MFTNLWVTYTAHNFDVLDKKMMIEYKITNKGKNYGNFFFEWIFEELSPEERERYKDHDVYYKWSVSEIYSFAHGRGKAIVDEIKRYAVNFTLVVRNSCVSLDDFMNVCYDIFKKVDEENKHYLEHKTVINNIATEK